MPGAAHVRAFEGVASLAFRTELHGRRALPSLGNPHVLVRAENPEAVIGVFAPQPDLDGLAGLETDLGRRG